MRETRNGLYTLAKTLLVYHMQKSKILKCGRYRSFLDTLVRHVTVAYRLQGLYAPKFLIPDTGRRFLITGRTVNHNRDTTTR